MQIIFLGTNGWYDSPTGKTPCVLLQTGREYVILDAGFGFTALKPWITEDLPVYLFLSHYHLDHTVGLHALPLYKFPQGIKIFGPSPAQETLEGLLRTPYSADINSMAFPVEIFNAEDGLAHLPFKVQALPLIHTAPTLGYRFDIDRKVITYCTDTGYCANAVILGRGADVYISECTLLPGEDDGGWPHLNPELAAGIANEAQVKRLVLIHFDASKYRTAQDREIAQRAAHKTFANTLTAYDGLTLTL